MNSDSGSDSNNSKRNDGFGTFLGILGGVAATAGAAYLVSKLADDQTDPWEKRVEKGCEKVEKGLVTFFSAFSTECGVCKVEIEEDDDPIILQCMHRVHKICYYCSLKTVCPVDGCNQPFEQYRRSQEGESDPARDNRANQLNPNHIPTGPGRRRGYHGTGDRADLNNHSNQKNPNNWRYQGPDFS